MNIIKSSRLIIRAGLLTDTNFILALLNQPSFYQYIADKGIYTQNQAAEYIQTAFIDAHEKQGFGPYIVTLRDGTPIGMAGLFKRDYLQVPDIGYAFLAQFTGNGYASEACESLMTLMSNRFGVLAAITTKDNCASQQVLHKLTFTKQCELTVSQDRKPVWLYIKEL
ncbi:GNAT family N-acetyltransferase [Pseudoalteromonas shioyasakiensis]|uniref:GNAT family N-acetyltransferase n=1 Tax=Pseudoalteromonas shioyasakiensis TaxID=1190813 RepID=UPI002117EA2B|nr:GNAT family N-acetyltransferase [Pseudoalteromonas shioyasakiensis]MCQ8878512.1 GNAT family N-acetyltransferase [Pseudoalteromonas shioyasakiensis]